MNFNTGPYHYEWVETPIYKSYKVVKHRRAIYCEECGDFQEWDYWTEKVGVGRKIGVKRTKQRVYELPGIIEQKIMPRIIDNVLSENTYLSRILGEQKKK